MKAVNKIKLTLPSLSANEGFARVAVGAFVSQLDPTVDELADIKTAVSEAVTNAIVHGYREKEGKIYITVSLYDNNIVRAKIRDKGIGIENIEQAMQPLFTTGAENERSGMGFSFMEAFMDELEVDSTPGEGTTIRMQKEIGYNPWIYEEE